MTSRASDREEKRLRLIAAAATVFARQGYTSTRMADIAVEASVGKGTLYEYFPSKEELFFAVFETIHVEARSRVAEAVPAEIGGLTRLRETLMAAADFVTESREMHGVTLDFWAASIGSPHEDRFRRLCGAMYREWREIAAATIRDGQMRGEINATVDADAVATMMVAALDGLGVQYWFDPSLDPRAVVDRYVDAVCTGLVPNDGPARNPQDSVA